MENTNTSTAKCQSCLHVNVQLRVATFDDFTRINSLGKKVWLQQKDFWAMNNQGNLEYYRLDSLMPGESIFGMLKDLVPAGRIYVVDVEGKRDEFFNNLNSNK